MTVRLKMLLALKFLLPAMLVSPAIAQEKPSEAALPKTATETPRVHTLATFGETIKGQSLLDDLDQFRSLLKREWILSNLNNADFDAAIDIIARDAPAGMTIAELSRRLQRVIAMGGDGHAGIANFPMNSLMVPGVRPDFLVDITGDGYTAYLVESAPGGPVNPAYEHRFVPLKEGYPHLVSIDGLPISEWVRAAEPYISRATELSTRWQAMRLLQELPFLRRELHRPDAPTIRVVLASADRKSEVEFDAVTNRYQRWQVKVPKPDHRIIDGNIGYVWISDAMSGGVEVFLRAMPKLRNTRGLILDLRDNQGGNVEALQVIAAALLPSDRPRRAVGRVIHWQGDGRNDEETNSDSEGLSVEGRRVVTAFEKGFQAKWQPPKGRATEAKTIFLARGEAEPNLPPYNEKLWPKIDPYTAPVVVLSNHRCFSAAELFLAGVREVADVTLVGSASTRGGGGSPKFFALRHSGLDVMLSGRVFVRADGTPIDGRGITPDVVVEPDADYYLGRRDRMLDKAIEVLQGKIAARR